MNPFVRVAGALLSEASKQHPNSAPARAEAAASDAGAIAQPGTLLHTMFQVEDMVGEGSFGRVFRCRHRLDGTQYAVKVSKQPLKRQKADSSRQAVIREVLALAALRSTAHLVRYHTAWEEGGHIFVQSELCEGGSLEARTAACGPGHVWSEPVLRSVLRQISKALHVLHDANLVHLDVKPANIYISYDDNGSDNFEDIDESRPALGDTWPPALERCTLKLGDMGMLAAADSEDVGEGDKRYLARNLLQEERPDLRSCDIFSLGASVYEMALGTPLPGQGAEWHRVRDGRPLEPPSASCSPALFVIIKSMLGKATARPTAHEILLNPLLASKEQREIARLRQQLGALHAQASRLGIENVKPGAGSTTSGQDAAGLAAIAGQRAFAPSPPAAVLANADGGGNVATKGFPRATSLSFRNPNFANPSPASSPMSTKLAWSESAKKSALPSPAASEMPVALMERMVLGPPTRKGGRSMGKRTTTSFF